MTRLASIGRVGPQARRPGLVTLATPSGRRALVAWVVALAAALVVLAAGGAGAQDAPGQDAPGQDAGRRDGRDEDAGVPASELGLEVVQGYGGETVRSAWTPVAVFLAPDRPVRGELTLRTGGRTGGPGSGEVAESRPVEVAAGARTVHRFLVPARQVTVVLDEPDRQPVTVEPRPGAPGRGFLAGVLGTAPRGLPGLQAEETRMNGTWVPVEPGWLEQSTMAMEPLGTLVAERDELAELSSAAAANLAAGVVAGTWSSLPTRTARSTSRSWGCPPRPRWPPPPSPCPPATARGARPSVRSRPPQTRGR